jgi:hypothetical protein
MSDSEYKFSNERDFLMYYHTTIRNVGLYTSVALAALIGSASFLNKDKKKIYGMLILILSFSFIIMALQMAYLLNNDINLAVYKLDSEDLKSWTLIPRVVFVVNIGLTLVILGLLTSNIKM